MSRHQTNDLAILHSNHDVMKYIGSPYSLEKTKQKITDSESHWFKHGFGLFSWYEKDNKDFIGRGGLRWQILDDGEHVIELAYMMMPKHFGKGYATEVGNYCFMLNERLYNFNRIVSLTTPNNSASKKVMRRLNMNFLPNTINFRGTKHIMATSI